MTLFMPPIQRKKKVDEKYNPDSFRVISEDAVSDHPKYRPLPYRASFEPRTPTPKAPQRNNNASEGEPCVAPVLEPVRALKNTRVLPQILPDYRANKPQARACGFLDRNVRFLNEPICNVYTKPVQHEEKQWWPTRPNPGDLQVPPYAEDTHYRTDYNNRHGERPDGSGRHTSNVHRDPALGTVPVNYLREKDGSQRFYKEGMSYEHMYNCRSDPSYPIRGKRHGAFVWSRMDPISQKKFIEYYQRLEEQERAQQQEGGPSPPEKAQSAVVVRSANSNNSNSNRSGQNSPKRRSSSTSVHLRSRAASNSNGSDPVPLVPTAQAAPTEKQSPAPQESQSQSQLEAKAEAVTALVESSVPDESKAEES